MPYTHYKKVMQLYHVLLQLFDSAAYGFNSLSSKVCLGEDVCLGTCMHMLEAGVSKLVSLHIWRTSSNFMGCFSLNNTIMCPLSFRWKTLYTSLTGQEGHKIALIHIYTHFKEYFYLSYNEELMSSSKDIILQHKAVDWVIFERTAELMLPEQSQNYEIFFSVFFLNVY